MTKSQTGGGVTAEFDKTERTAVRRVPQNATYDKETIYKILDEAFVCHIGFIADGKPVVIPTAYGRIGDKLYIHGAPASRMLRSLSGDIDICVTVTLLDGLVLARSAFHHTFNYRSVVIFGKAEQITERAEKIQALYAFSEHIIEGRWQDVREPNEKELSGTLVLSVPLNEVSAKVRGGPPEDDPQDLDLPIWGGVIPLTLVADQPISDPKLPSGIKTPSYAITYKRSGVAE